MHEQVAPSADVSEDPHGRGDLLNAISDGMVALLKECQGRGPKSAKSYYQDDLVVCVFRGNLSRAEQTLLEGGKEQVVLDQRHALQLVLRPRFNAVVTSVTGREVIAFTSGNQLHPDVMTEQFLLAAPQ